MPLLLLWWPMTRDLYVFLGPKKYELQILLWLNQQLSFGPSKLPNFTSSYISSLKAMQRFVLMCYLLSNKIFLGLWSSIVMISLIFLINLLVQIFEWVRRRANSVARNLAKYVGTSESFAFCI